MKVNSIPCSTPSLKLWRAQGLPHCVRKRQGVGILLTGVRRWLRTASAVLQTEELPRVSKAPRNSIPCSTPSLKLRRAQVLPHCVRKRRGVGILLTGVRRWLRAA
jgi:hypothetical protein